MMQNPSNPRMRGVVANIPVENGTPKTVRHVAPLAMYVVEYVDGNGSVHTIVVSEFNGRIYLAPNGEEWARSQKLAADWLEKGISEKVNVAKEMAAAKASGEVAPREDAVDPTSDG